MDCGKGNKLHTIFYSASKVNSSGILPSTLSRSFVFVVHILSFFDIFNSFCPLIFLLGHTLYTFFLFFLFFEYGKHLQKAKVCTYYRFDLSY